MRLTTLQQALPDFTLKRIGPRDYQAVFDLERTQPDYHQYLTDAKLTLAEVRADATAIPAGVDASQKLYLGCWIGEHLVAVLDLIGGYPSSDFVYIGLLMVDAKYQRHQVGGTLVQGLTRAAKQSGYHYLQLGRVIANPVPEKFWKKLGFEDSHQVSLKRVDGESIPVMIMQKELE